MVATLSTVERVMVATLSTVERVMVATLSTVDRGMVSTLSTVERVMAATLCTVESDGRYTEYSRKSDGSYTETLSTLESELNWRKIGQVFTDFKISRFKILLLLCKVRLIQILKHRILLQIPKSPSTLCTSWPQLHPPLTIHPT